MKVIGFAQSGAKVEVLDAVLRYEDGVGGAQREERVFLGARSTDDPRSLTQGKAKSVEDAFLRAKDAAATLEKIENERNVQNARSRNQPMPVPSPAASSPTSMTPEEQRTAHDKAIRQFQIF